MRARGASDVKGASDIKGLHSLNMRLGPVTESNKLLKLYQLSVEKDSISKKLARIKWQKVQTERRLAEITGIIYAAVHQLENIVKKASSSNAAASRNTHIEY